MLNARHDLVSSEKIQRSASARREGYTAPPGFTSDDFVYSVNTTTRFVFSRILYNAQFTKFVKLLKPRTLLFALQGIAAGVSV